MRSDEHYTSVTYAQEVRGVRPDVVAIDVELLKLPTYVDLVEARHPDVNIPFPSYDGGVTRFLADLINLEIGARPVFIVGDMEEDLAQRFDIVDHGLADRVLPDGEAPDKLGVLREDTGLIDRLHPPDRAYAETTWEAAIAAHYADVAFQTGVALQELGPQPDAAEVERLYRRAIQISPTIAGAYKNLGILLQTNGGAPHDIIGLWERYLELRPEDEQAGAIRATIDRLRGEASPAP
jgi:tetratricopeptide (TPR) repeat protein